MGRPVFGSTFKGPPGPVLGPGDPGWEPARLLGLSGAFGLNGPGDLRFGVTGGVSLFPESTMLFCFINIGGFFPSPLGCVSILWGDGGPEPFAMAEGPAGFASPRARCI